MINPPKNRNLRVCKGKDCGRRINGYTWWIQIGSNVFCRECYEKNRSAIKYRTKSVSKRKA